MRICRPKEVTRFGIKSVMCSVFQENHHEIFEFKKFIFLLEFSTKNLWSSSGGWLNILLYIEKVKQNMRNKTDSFTFFRKNTNSYAYIK